ARPEHLHTPARIKRFLREGEAAAQLHHPHIVPLFDSGRDGPHYYLAYALIRGGTLAGLLEAKQAQGTQRPLEPRRAAALVRDLAAALAYAHRRKVTHRDVKPGNVLLDEDGLPLLADFGLAAWEDDSAERLTQESTKGMGTAPYMAPEQARGKAE